jgi:hypothetical protein
MAELIWLFIVLLFGFACARLAPVFRGVEGMQSESDLDRIK